MISNDSLEVIVPAWDNSRLVSLPMSLIPNDCAEAAKYSKRLVAYVNLDAINVDELEFKSFEVVSKLNEDDF